MLSARLAQVLLRLEREGPDDGTDRRGTTLGCLRDQLARGGVPALFRGMGAKLLQTVLTSAFMFGTYEQTLRTVGGAYELLDRRR